MSDAEILEKLTAIFRDVLDDDGIVLTETTTADDLEEWDSLNQIKIILQCERVFDRSLNSRKITMLENVGQMVAYLRTEIAG